MKCDSCSCLFERELRFVKSAQKRGRKFFFCSRTCGNSFAKVNKVKCSCSECDKEFYRKPSELVKSTRYFCDHVCSAKFNNRLKTDIKTLNGIKLKKDLKSEKLKRIKISCICSCSYCNTEVLRTKTELKRNQRNLVFCSKSCRMTYQNLHDNIRPIVGSSRSKAEDYLLNLLKSSFPDLKIESNNRSILPSKLEIDIYIPEFKFGIELNGPIHYMPIYGLDTLEKCQRKDFAKNQECLQLGISLMTLDISRLNSTKRSNLFLEETFKDTIKPIIDEFRCRGETRTREANGNWL